MKTLRIFSAFHYEVTENYYRYTDEEWKEKFLADEMPPRPDWVAEYVAGNKGEVLPEGRKVSGIVNTEMYTHTREIVVY